MSSHEAAERAARDGYGRLVAFLSVRCRDLATVEDALSEAFLQALEVWPTRGVPDQPEAWLLTVARRRMTDQARSRNSQNISVDALELGVTLSESDVEIPDERLKLLFVCTHPAIDAASQTPLMLQTVLGFDAATIAKAFVVSPVSMSQRLVRAKTRIRDLQIPFVIPEVHELPTRLDAVLNAIYAVYGSAWEDSDSSVGERGLVREAIHLARVLCSLMPSEPEPRGLLALMLHCEARRQARQTSDGSYVPLLEQDTRLWDRAGLIEADQHLWQASRLQQPGPFQLEAAIQSAHNHRAYDGITPWADILILYRQLIQHRDTLGARVAYAAALGLAGQAAEGLNILNELIPADVENYQPFWVVSSHLWQLQNHSEAATAAKKRALELTKSDAVRRYLEGC
jgi:predicted RNA polymerase sigma factor